MQGEKTVTHFWFPCESCLGDELQIIPGTGIAERNILAGMDSIERNDRNLKWNGMQLMLSLSRFAQWNGTVLISMLSGH